jgi:Family of unknown function (DUF6132)
MKTLVKYKVILLGIGVGALTGYLYYYFVGCASGQCPITSNPLISTVYGALMGGVFFDLFTKKPIKTENDEHRNNN